APASGTEAVPSADAWGSRVEPDVEPVVELAPVEPSPSAMHELSALAADVGASPSAVVSERAVAPDVERSSTAPIEVVPYPPVRPAPRLERPKTQPAPPEPRRSRARVARWARFGAFVAVAAVVGAVAPKVLPVTLPGEGDGDGRLVTPPDQNVVAWTVRLDEAPDATFVAILAAGVKPPVILAVPADVTINVPGQGLGTVGEAAAGGDVGLVGVALENLLGVRMDGSVDSTTAELQAAVDALGTIEVADQPMAGAQVIQYLTVMEPGALPDERFLRWQDVLEGIRDGVAANPDAVAGFPEPLRPVLAAGSPEPMALYGLPVVDLGAGLLRPDEQGLETLVKDLFVPHAGAEVRIVVLNGVGRPGVGEEVARILVPEGYRLMSTGNANTFGVKTTKIIALSEGDLAAAQRAQGLLGVGEVLMAEPTGLADVQIVVGEDFVNAHLGGA
ncbi:MAG TPA: LytR C-terminal domain-containing protein, partial [Actinomycetota bacterium]|nr:LytR C-terminal domain-containing protein [Actinomycetota bacterium]